jgi:hypothetical protein
MRSVSLTSPPEPGAHYIVTPAHIRLGGSVASAVIADLDAADLAELARLLGLAEAAADTDDDRWLNSGDAAAYLGITANALHKLTAARALPFEQEAPGCKCYFRKAALDAYRRGELS